MIIRFNKSEIGRMLFRDVRFIIVTVILFLLFLLLSYVMDVFKKWDDISTWTSGVYILPMTVAKNNNFTLTQNGDVYTLDVPNCMMYYVKVIPTLEKDMSGAYEATDAVYKCSYLPDSEFETKRLNADATSLDGAPLSPDLQWKYIKGESAKPTEYIIPILSDFSYISDLDSPKKVKVHLEYSVKKTDYTIANLLAHYNDYKNNKKTQLSVKLTAWGVSLR